MSTAAATATGKKKILADPELAAMQRIERLLRELDEPARGRVLRWVNERMQGNQQLLAPVRTPALTGEVKQPGALYDNPDAARNSQKR